MALRFALINLRVEIMVYDCAELLLNPYPTPTPTPNPNPIRNRPHGCAELVSEDILQSPQDRVNVRVRVRVWVTRVRVTLLVL